MITQANQTADVSDAAMGDVDFDLDVSIVESGPAVDEPLLSNTVLDRATADLFELDVRVNPVSVPYAPNCSDTTDDGCSAECPSVGCTATCRC